MINLSFDELRLIAQIRNLSDYENKSKEDLIKAFSETKQKTTKLETPKQKTPKLETSKQKTPKQKTPKSEKLKPEKAKSEKKKLEIRVNKKKLKKLRKDFDELRHKFSKIEIDRYRKVFYVAKNKNRSKSETTKTNKSFNKLKKSLRFKKFRGDIGSVDYEDLDNYDYNYDFADDDEYRKIGSIRTLWNN